MKNYCIGLFGTCGGSTWRDSFIRLYHGLGIRYFNPQVDDWTPECADIEAAHLTRDDIILFPVTAETYGTGSLAETGFSILQAIASRSNRYVVVMIEPEPADALKADAVAYKESVRARKLVAAHLKKVNHPNVFVVDTLDQMRMLSVELHHLIENQGDLEQRFRNVA